MVDERDAAREKGRAKPYGRKIKNRQLSLTVFLTCGNHDRIHGGDGEDRTLDLLNAIQALSQLSYAPIP